MFRNNKTHTAINDLKIGKKLFKKIIEEKTILFVGFTGQLLNSDTYPSILKLLNYTSKLIITPCAVYKEILFFNPNFNSFKNKKMSISLFLKELGLLINNNNSFLFKAFKYNIDVFMPIIEGPLAILLINQNIKLDVISDIKKLNRFTLFCDSKTACLIFGIGIVKHHILNANLFREGSDFTILVNTAVEFDGSDAGAELEEAKSWGKVQLNGIGIKIRFCPTLIIGELLKSIL